MDLSDMIDEQDKEIAALKAKLARVDGCVDGPIMMSSEAFQAVEDIRAILSAEPKVLAVVDGYCDIDITTQDPWVYDQDDDECVGVFKNSVVDGYDKKELDPVTVIVLAKEES